MSKRATFKSTTSASSPTWANPVHAPAGSTAEGSRFVVDRLGADLHDIADHLLEQLVLLPVAGVLGKAATLTDPALRLADVLHLAAARSAPTTWFVTYDPRLSAAAKEFEVTSPGVVPVTESVIDDLHRSCSSSIELRKY